MITTCFGGEFGYDLICVAPYAYWLSNNKLLEATVGAKDSRCLFYFSPHHAELFEKRLSVDAFGCPNLRPFDKELNKEQWIPPPYKQYYKNDFFQSEKPLLILCNKYDGNETTSPVNYIDIPTLNELVQTLSKKYTIIYSRPRFDLIIQDGTTKIYDFDDHQFLRNSFNSIVFVEDLYRACLKQTGWEGLTFNTFQMLLYSNCENFISVQGGNSILASYFGGKNLIFSRNSAESDNGCFDTYYKDLSGCDIKWTDDYVNLMYLTRKHFHV